MKKGTVLVKKPSRDEIYWVVVIFSCYFSWQIFHLIFQNSNTATYATTALLVLLVVLKFTLLRTWSENRLEWSADDKNLYLNGSTIPLDSFNNVYFQRNKLTGMSWLLHAKGVYRIRMESLSFPASKRAESLETLKELAFVMDPSLKSKPHLLPDP